MSFVKKGGWAAFSGEFHCPASCQMPAVGPTHLVSVRHREGPPDIMVGPQEVCSEVKGAHFKHRRPLGHEERVHQGST